MNMHTAIAPVCTRSQRWRERRTMFVGDERVINPDIHSVDVIDKHNIAKAFVEQHHYAGSLPATRLICGLYRNEGQQSALVGIACFSVSMQRKAAAKHTGLDESRAVELGRLVLLDHVEANAESWFMARAFALLRREKPLVEAVFSYSDPVIRKNAQGEQLLVGHVGSVYQALGASCRGRSSPRTLLTMPDGKIASDRALSKLRNGECGTDYVERMLLNAGAPKRTAHEEPSAWLARLRQSGFFNEVKHPGNWVYSFALTKDARRADNDLPKLPYPKRDRAITEGDVSLMELFKTS